MIGLSTKMVRVKKVDRGNFVDETGKVTRMKCVSRARAQSFDHCEIAPSPAAHARTCCEDFLQMTRRGNGIRDSRNLCFWPTTQHVYVCWNLA